VLPKQRLILIAAALGGLFALYAGTAYWAGVKAENTLEEQHRLLVSLPIFKVKSYSYDRGWFSSREHTELVFNRRLTGPYENLLPDNLRPLLGSTISFTNTVKHGPLPGLGSFDLRPASALVTTQFDMSDSTRKTLALFFGDKPPITVTNRLGFASGGQLNVNVPAFDYEEALSGVKVKWQGFNLTVDYRHGFKEYQAEADSPGFSLEAASKGTVHFDGVRYLSDVRPGATGIRLGSSDLSVNNVTLNWNDSIPYSIKLNDLVYLLTRIHVGEFINPSGELKPSNVTLKGLHYRIVTSEQDQFINTRGRLDFSSFGFNNLMYGPLRLDVSAEHLDGASLAKLDQAIANIPVEGVDPAALRKQYISTIKQYGIPLLENDPKLLINDFYLGMPNGAATVKGVLALHGLKSSDLKDPLLVLKRVEAKAQLSLPRQTLEDLVVTQARNLFTVDQSAEDQPNLKEIDDLAKNLLDSQLNQWSEQGYIHQDRNQLSTSVDYHDGELRISQKRVPLPWQVDEDPTGPNASDAAHATAP
jgi:uncharacterized protein YdgA (DUF945 family)